MKCYMVLEIINGPTYKIPEMLLQTGQRPKEYRHYNSGSKVEFAIQLPNTLSKNTSKKNDIQYLKH